MNAIVNQPPTNLPCQHGISIAQRGWMYENMGYSASAMAIYQQAVRTLSRGITQLGEAAPDDALFHLGASQLRLGCMNQRMGNRQEGRRWMEASLPNLEAAWKRLPSNLWYQQALAQASMLLEDTENLANDAAPDWTNRMTNDVFGAALV